MSVNTSTAYLPLVTLDTTNATSVSTGALIVSGGGGISKTLYVGQGAYITGDINISANIVGTSTNTDIQITPNGTGRVLLNADPTSNLHATTKQYVDIKSKSLNYTFATNAASFISVATTTTFTSLALFLFKGTASQGTLDTAQIVYELSGGSRTVTVRIFDITNSLTIASASVGTSPVATSIISLGAVSNLPTGAAIFAVQVNRAGTGGGTTNIRLSSLDLYKA